jgi:hypothetical protein
VIQNRKLGTNSTQKSSSDIFSGQGTSSETYGRYFVLFSSIVYSFVIVILFCRSKSLFIGIRNNFSCGKIVYVSCAPLCSVSKTLETQPCKCSDPNENAILRRTAITCVCCGLCKIPYVYIPSVLVLGILPFLNFVPKC